MNTPRAITTRCLLGLTAATLALAILSCGREPAAPAASNANTGSVRFSHGLAWVAEFPGGLPAFQASGGSGVEFTKIHVVLNNPDGSVALTRWSTSRPVPPSCR